MGADVGWSQAGKTSPKPVNFHSPFPSQDMSFPTWAPEVRVKLHSSKDAPDVVGTQLSSTALNHAAQTHAVSAQPKATGCLKSIGMGQK